MNRPLGVDSGNTAENHTHDFCTTAVQRVTVNIAQGTHYENTPIQIYRKFHFQNIENFQVKNSDIFLISAQNIDCGYSLEPPRRGGSNENPQFMFSAEINKKIMYILVNTSFTI